MSHGGYLRLVDKVVVRVVLALFLSSLWLWLRVSLLRLLMLALLVLVLPRLCRFLYLNSDDLKLSTRIIDGRELR